MSSTSPVPRSYPFAIANIFTQDSLGGNPATIIFLDPKNTLTQEERLKFAKGFNQPIICYLTPNSSAIDRPGVISFDIRYFSPNCELEICGHGTLAAMKVVLDSATNSPGFGEGTQFPAFSSPDTHTVEFTTMTGTVISSRRVEIEKEDWFEIDLPAATVKTLPAEEEKRIIGVFAQAIGREPKVKYIGMGQPPFYRYILVVLEESENLEELKFVDVKILKSTGVDVHVVTTDSTSGKFPEDYLTRLFAPAIALDEDHACGSANCVMAPYWAAQKGLTELKARQVSERGGRLSIGVYGNVVQVRGQAKVTTAGRLYL